VDSPWGFIVYPHWESIYPRTTTCWKASSLIDTDKKTPGQARDNVTIVDIRLEKAFQIGGRARLTGLFDSYNLFNSNPETNFAVRTGRNHQNIIAVLDPRVVKIGVRFQF
jgi:outer membrane receptor protein involved in Fe transport